MQYIIETEQEDDGRWIADIPELPGVMCYGDTREAAIVEVTTLADKVVGDREDHQEGDRK
jgi:predicted RNase H-like HicB family nuclease